MRDPLPIVCKLGDRLPWRDQKAIVLMAALNGPWEAAGQFADAFGIHPEQQQAIYDEAVAKRASEPGLHSDEPLGARPFDELPARTPAPGSARLSA